MYDKILRCKGSFIDLIINSIYKKFQIYDKMASALAKYISIREKRKKEDVYFIVVMDALLQNPIAFPNSPFTSFPLYPLNIVSSLDRFWHLNDGSVDYIPIFLMPIRKWCKFWTRYICFMTLLFAWSWRRYWKNWRLKEQESFWTGGTVFRRIEWCAKRSFFCDWNKVTTSQARYICKQKIIFNQIQSFLAIRSIFI